MILHDATITDLDTKKPLTRKDLEGIYGLGPMKIKKYGDELLKIINGF